MELSEIWGHRFRNGGGVALREGTGQCHCNPEKQPHTQLPQPWVGDRPLASNAPDVMAISPIPAWGQWQGTSWDFLVFTQHQPSKEAELQKQTASANRSPAQQSRVTAQLPAPGSASSFDFGSCSSSQEPGKEVEQVGVKNKPVRCTLGECVAQRGEEVGELWCLK